MAPPMVQLYHNRNVNKNSLLFKVDYTRVLSKKTGDVVIPCDLSDNVKELHIFLYEDSAYTASDTVKQNSEKIVSDTGFKSGDGH